MLSDGEDHSTVDLARPQPVENVIYRLQRHRLDGRLYLALGGKRQRFLQVLARAHNRPPDGVAVQDHIENGNRKVARRQSIQHAGAAAAQHADRLLEGNG